MVSKHSMNYKCYTDDHNNKNNDNKKNLVKDVHGIAKEMALSASSLDCKPMKIAH